MKHRPLTNPDYRYRLFDSNRLPNMFDWFRHYFVQMDAIPLDVQVKILRPARSINQNSTMHMWFDEISQFTGDSTKSVKEDFKAEFLPEIDGKLFGRGRIKGTHELTKEECAVFMTQIQLVARDMGIQLTEPR